MTICRISGVIQRSQRALKIYPTFVIPAKAGIYEAVAMAGFLLEVILVLDPGRNDK
jgi:hypothetical protein